VEEWSAALNFLTMEAYSSIVGSGSARNNMEITRMDTQRLKYLLVYPDQRILCNSYKGEGRFGHIDYEGQI
jgi:hypothetical protein